jgi:hypothetical protein
VKVNVTGGVVGKDVLLNRWERNGSKGFFDETKKEQCAFWCTIWMMTMLMMNSIVTVSYFDTGHWKKIKREYVCQLLMLYPKDEGNPKEQK